ncbi:SDR family oxidoreductase [Streptomyces sp. NPDC006863]|uniref:SDR family oxidoreductase n=1 Tax=Streptomyces sp. NPDC006863 TaxID=3154779 RepID=UPI0033CC6BC6
MREHRQRRVTVVTGGSRGIGASVCLRMAAEGHEVAVGYRSDAEAAREVVEKVRALGRSAIAVAVDTADAADVDRLFDTVAAQLGPVTGLVNNAGVSGPVGPLADADPDGMRQALEVNVLGYLLCARRAIGAMTAGGAIVNISSAAATLGSPGTYVHYAAAKAAVDAMTVGLSKEVAADGIRVNGVAPGTVWTDFHADPQRPAKVAALVPMGRAGRPEEIAGAVAWLLSDDASYATGTVMRIAGGM